MHSSRESKLKAKALKKRKLQEERDRKLKELEDAGLPLAGLEKEVIIPKEPLEFLSTQVRRDFIIYRSPTDPTQFVAFENKDNRLPACGADSDGDAALQASLNQEFQGITPYYDRNTEKSTMYVQRISVPPKGPSDEEKKIAMKSRPVRFPLLTVEYPDSGIKYSLIGTDGLMQWFFELLNPETRIIDVGPTVDVSFGTSIGSIRDNKFFSHELAALHWRTVSLHRRLERILFSGTPRNACPAGNLKCRDHFYVKMILAVDETGVVDPLNGLDTRYTRHVICENMMLWQVFESLTGVKPDDRTVLIQLRHGSSDRGLPARAGPYSYGRSKLQKTLNMDLAWYRNAYMELEGGIMVKKLSLMPFETEWHSKRYSETAP